MLSVLRNRKRNFGKRTYKKKEAQKKIKGETADMLFYGLWQCKEKVDHELSKIESVKEKQNL